MLVCISTWYTISTVEMVTWRNEDITLVFQIGRILVRMYLEAYMFEKQVYFYQIMGPKQRRIIQLDEQIRSLAKYPGISYKI